MSFGMPGINGSLGTCAVCGGCFAVEVLMGKNVKTFTVAFIEGELYAHDHCEDTIKAAFAVALKEPEGMAQAAALRSELAEETPIWKALTKYIEERL